MRFISKFFTSDVLSVLFRLVVGIVFIYASIYKIRLPEEFARSISYYRALPVSLVNIMAIILPWLELFTGIMLILGVFSKSNALIVAVMLFVFIIAISQALMRGIDISCGCFRAESQEKIGVGLLMRDIIWLLMCIQIMGFDSARFSLRRLLSKRPQSPQV